MYSSFSTREIVFTGLMTALVFIATFVPHIPIPLGYAHLGDAVIFLLALLVPRRPALIAACLGSALAEIVYRIAAQGRAIGQGRIVTALLLSSLWMAFAYTLVGAVLYDGLIAALTSTPGLIVEGIVNSVIALLLLPMLRGRMPQI